jgi:hypothetical protein
MSTELQDRKTETSYHVVSVEKTDAPEGMPGNNWHRYVIGRGSSVIEGFKPGTLKAVTQHAESCAEDLNARAFKGYSAYAPRKKK